MGRHLKWSRATGLALLASIPLWWIGLRAWANSQYGYLDLDVTGASPLRWLALVLLAGAGFATGWLPGRIGAADTLLLAALLLPAGLLAAGNLIAGADGGISGAGLVMAGLSLAQVALVIGPFVVRARTRGQREAPAVG